MRGKSFAELLGQSTFDYLYGVARWRAERGQTCHDIHSILIRAALKPNRRALAITDKTGGEPTGTTENVLIAAHCELIKKAESSIIGMADELYQDLGSRRLALQILLLAVEDVLESAYPQVTIKL